MAWTNSKTRKALISCLWSKFCNCKEYQDNKYLDEINYFIENLDESKRVYKLTVLNKKKWNPVINKYIYSSDIKDVDWLIPDVASKLINCLNQSREFTNANYLLKDNVWTNNNENDIHIYCMNIKNRNW